MLVSSDRIGRFWAQITIVVPLLIKTTVNIAIQTPEQTTLIESDGQQWPRLTGQVKWQPMKHCT